MFTEAQLQQLIVLDIETIPAYPDYQDVPPAEKQLWDRKSGRLSSDLRDPAALYPRAGIYAEFGRIICISVGRMQAGQFRIHSFSGGHEKLVLEQFVNYLRKNANKRSLLCAHNGKEFDFPYIARRMLVNRIVLPELLDLAGKKPWEIMHLDTLELWKFGDYKHYTSLETLSHLFGLPSPKQETDGSKIADLWWKSQDIRKIRAYCEQDVLTVFNLMRCYSGLFPLQTADVNYQRH